MHSSWAMVVLLSAVPLLNACRSAQTAAIDAGQGRTAHSETLEVLVVDDSGQRIPDAEVILALPENPRAVVASTVTSASGGARLVVPSATYELTCKLSGFRTSVDPSVRVPNIQRPYVVKLKILVEPGCGPSSEAPTIRIQASHQSDHVARLRGAAA